MRIVVLQQLCIILVRFWVVFCVKTKAHPRNLYRLESYLCHPVPHFSELWHYSNPLNCERWNFNSSWWPATSYTYFLSEFHALMEINSIWNVNETTIIAYVAQSVAFLVGIFLKLNDWQFCIQKNMLKESDAITLTATLKLSEWVHEDWHLFISLKNREI